MEESVKDTEGRNRAKKEREKMYVIVVKVISLAYCMLTH